VFVHEDEVDEPVEDAVVPTLDLTPNNLTKAKYTNINDTIITIKM